MLKSKYFNEIDIDLLRTELIREGFSESWISEQISIINSNVAMPKEMLPCVKGDGVYMPSEDEKKVFFDYFKERAGQANAVKFVPSSGAATRLFGTISKYYHGEADIEINQCVQQVLRNINELAIFYNLKEKENLSPAEIIQKSIFSDKSGWGNKPKALIPFHVRNGKVYSAFKEQVIETLLWGELLGERIDLHFTVPENFLKSFKAEEDNIRTDSPFFPEISYSFQDKTTDVISFSEQGKIIRDPSGKVFLRPGGHGSLLYNLEKLKDRKDLIFIKNIDNIQQNKKVAVEWMTVILGLTLYLKDRVRKLYLNISNGEDSSVEQAKTFLKKWFGYTENDFQVLQADILAGKIIKILNRPLRVCGVVANKGEKGGLPFLFKSSDGLNSREFVEGVELASLSCDEQNKLINSSTHFNPVFMGLWLKDPNNNSFDLKFYRDINRSMRINKDYNNSKIITHEWPGLWNGSMSFWNTVFIDIPRSVFTPVKTIEDLLGESHLSVSDS